MNTNRKQLLISLGVYLAYVILILAANLMPQQAQGTPAFETWYEISGISMGLFTIPVLSIILPLWLARKWNLDVSFWPRHKPWLMPVLLVCLYVVVNQYNSIQIVAGSGISVLDLSIHYITSTMFHITYYPLFVALIFPVIRRNYNTGIALASTAALFALYHLVQFFYFPAGTTPFFQLILFGSFLFSLLIYLWSQNLILVMLMHTINGALGLATNGTLFNEVDALLYVTIIILVGFFSYMIVYEVRHRDRTYHAGWWLHPETE